MSTYITLEDGRVFAASNGLFDAILESAAEELRRNRAALEGLADWLLEQRCQIQGPGVGYLDVRELSSRAASEFRSACIAAHTALISAQSPWSSHLSLLISMWASISRGEPPETQTSPHYRILNYDGSQRGPGWD